MDHHDGDEALSEEMKVGELAERTGVSVRTLHFYEKVGLLEPARRTDAGHRIYGLAETERLQQIRSLVQLGFSLEEVRDCLQNQHFSPAKILQLHLAALDEAMERQRRLRLRLGFLAQRLESVEGASAEDFINTIEEITMLEKHYTPEQLEQLHQRAEQVGAERIIQVQEEWRRLIAEVKAEMDGGIDLLAPSVRVLAGRWQSLVDEFTGGDPGIQRSLGNLYREDQAMITERHGDAVPKPEIFAYIQPALADLAAKKS